MLTHDFPGLRFNLIPADSAISKSRDSLSVISSHDEPEIQGGGAITIGLIMLVIVIAAIVGGVIAYPAPLL